MAFGVLTGFGGGKLAHVHDAGPTGAGWSYPVHHMAGADPSVSIYDADYGAVEGDVDRGISGGFLRAQQRLPLDAPTMTRTSRVGAQQDSLPAAHFFQSYTGSGTGRNWSGGAVAQTTGSAPQGWNPHMAGAAELFPATTYNPFPNPGNLYPKVV